MLEVAKREQLRPASHQARGYGSSTGTMCWCWRSEEWLPHSSCLARGPGGKRWAGDGGWGVRLWRGCGDDVASMQTATRFRGRLAVARSCSQARRTLFLGQAAREAGRASPSGQPHRAISFSLCNIWSAGRNGGAECGWDTHAPGVVWKARLAYFWVGEQGWCFLFDVRRASPAGRRPVVGARAPSIYVVEGVGALPISALCSNLFQPYRLGVHGERFYREGGGCKNSMDVRRPVQTILNTHCTGMPCSAAWPAA